MSTDALTPELLQSALDDWDSLAFLAYDGFIRAGRGLLDLEQVPESISPVRVRASYVTFPAGKPHPETARVVSAYDPDDDFVVMYREPAGGIRTQRLRTGPEGRAPKRVWFFEQLRRMHEDEEYVPEKAPEWFWDLLEKIDAKNRQADV
ncbi:MAG: hypothetical protein ACKVP2_13940 [Burkholderiales bacterium]